ncbi:tyrosyl-tRNA synthetase [Candidatus Zinderia insecticola CARI]|uniref:Tyrosine--tRNA ligase n=1 Tax=Zinderia insecticola (strain CARI) TaxID=871271 RepID=E0TIQ0_ZINIC|nr:tyrosyl-tRNA synthetase [Candidatus Zinderia insecticola CARI]
MFKNIKNKILNNIKEIYYLKELEKKYNNKKIIKIKLGFDPTNFKIHLGHYFLLKKIKNIKKIKLFNINIIIGNFTSIIGDPTGKKKTRYFLKYKNIINNSKIYLLQFGIFLNISKINIYYNSKWNILFKIKYFINLLSKFTLNKIIERKNFMKRIKNKKPIYLHEIIYSIIQAYDSVILDSDLEIGGIDQKFNLFFSRKLQKKINKKKQSILMFPFIKSLNFKKKMSKSNKKNNININDNYNIIFLKLMNISDNIMFHYYNLLLSYKKKKIFFLKKIKSGKYFKNMKIKLSLKIIKKIYNKFFSLKSLKKFINILYNKNNNYKK